MGDDLNKPIRSIGVTNLPVRVTGKVFAMVELSAE